MSFRSLSFVVVPLASRTDTTDNHKGEFSAMVVKRARCLVFVASCAASIDSCAASIDPHSVGTALLVHASSWKTVRTKAGSASVVIIENFLPHEHAHEFFATMNETWAAASACRIGGHCDDPADGACSWLYTTNSRGSNAKIRSVHRRDERRREVQDTYKRGGFAYSKWELTATHPLYATLGAVMGSEAVRHTIARVLELSDSSADDPRPALGNISDYFVTAYDDGDFLSTHSDGASGSLAWVYHLTGNTHGSGWDSAMGGQLRFNAMGAGQGARDFVPGHNRLLLFHTRPQFMPHQVLPLTNRDHGPRFGATGWWMTRGDRFDAATLRQNEMMKSAAMKSAQSGDMCL